MKAGETCLLMLISDVRPKHSALLETHKREGLEFEVSARASSTPNSRVGLSREREKKHAGQANTRPPHSTPLSLLVFELLGLEAEA